MGAWSVSINGNDLAQDMRAEYSIAFSRHAPQEAVALLDAYMHREAAAHDENDGDWVDYRYSLADFMWKKGVLYETLRDEVISMIDRGAGLDLYDDERTLRKREKVLAEFRTKLLSPQPERKPIRISGIQTKPLFASGDVIALQLLTANAPEETPQLKWDYSYDRTEYLALDKHWIALRKVGDEVSWRSQVDPSLGDLWPCYQLYAAVFPVCPTMADLYDIPFAKTLHTQDDHIPQRNDTLFTSNNTMTWNRKRSASMIGRDTHDLEKPQADLAVVNSRKRGCGIINIVSLDVLQHAHMQGDLELFGMIKGVPNEVSWHRRVPPESTPWPTLEELRRRMEAFLAKHKKT